MNLPSCYDLVQNPNVSWTLGDRDGVSGVKPSIELEARPLRVRPSYVEVLAVRADPEAPANVVTRATSGTGHQQASQSTKTQK